MNANPSPQVASAPRTRWGILLLIALLAATFVYFRRPSSVSPSAHPAVGQTAPQLLSLVPLLPELADMSPPDSLAVGGRVSLVHVWGTWCPPCRLEFPELAKMVQELSDQPGFRFVNISTAGEVESDLPGLRAETLEFYREIRASELVTFADRDGEVRQAISQTLGESMAYPTTLLIAGDGTVAGVWIGYSPSGVSEMRAMIDRLVEALPSKG